MSFCSTIYGNLPESGFVYTATTVSVDNGSFENLSATNATIVNLETTTFNPTNVDCTTLTADNASITNISGTNMTLDNLSVTNYDITTLQATTANISTINSSIINSSHSNLSTIGTFRINISEASDPALASVIRRDANNFLFEGRVDPTDPHATILFFTTEEGAGYGPTLQMNLSNVDIRNLSGDKLTYTNASIDNLSSTNIVASGAIDAFSMEASLLTATSNLATPFVNTSDLQTQLINSSQINASNISTRNLSAVLQITSTYIDATNTMTAPTLNTLVNNVSIVNSSTINSQTANISTSNTSTSNIQTILNIKDNVATNNDSTIQKTSGNLKLSVDGTQADIDIYTGGLVYIPTELDTTLMTALTSNITTGNISTLNVSNMNVCSKNANIINCSQINASDIDANTIDCDTLTGDISPNLAAGTGISLNTVAGITTISNTGSITDPLNLSKLNVSNISCDNIIETATSKTTIFELKDGSGGGGASGYIYNTANVMTLRTGAAGGVFEFGTTYAGNFSVQIANDALNASTANISQANASNMSLINLSADLITGDIGANLAAGTGISLNTVAGVTTITNTGGSVTDPLNISVINLSTLNGLTANVSTINSSTGNLALVNSSVVNSDFLNGNIANNLAAGTGISLNTIAGVTTITNTGGSVTDPLNLSKLNVSNISCDNIIETATSKTTIFELKDGSGGGGASGYIYNTANVMTLRTGAVGGVIEFGTTYGGNFSVQIANDALNASTINASTINASTITGDISPNLVAGTDITLNTVAGVTTINSTALSTSTQYAWCASSTLSGTSTLSAGTILQFDTLSGSANRDFETPAGNYSTGGYYYEVAVAGIYQVGFNLYTLNTESTAITAVVKDITGARGTYLNIGETGQETRSNEDFKVIANFDVGDRIYVRSSTQIVLNWVNSATFFYGNLLQPENNTITSSTALTTNSLTTSLTNVSNSNISNLTIDNNLNGYAFIRTIAIAKILANGINVKTIGCTISRSNTGRYACVLDVARSSSDYTVQLTVMEDSTVLDDVIISLTQGSMSTTGFLYVIHEQDNGGSPGTYRDRNHFVTVFDTD